MVTLDWSDLQASLAGSPCQSFCRRASSWADSDALLWRLVMRVLEKLLLREIWKQERWSQELSGKVVQDYGLSQGFSTNFTCGSGGGSDVNADDEVRHIQIDIG
jgi:hypothetical protein